MTEFELPAWTVGLPDDILIVLEDHVPQKPYLQHLLFKTDEALLVIDNHRTPSRIVYMAIIAAGDDGTLLWLGYSQWEADVIYGLDSSKMPAEFKDAFREAAETQLSARERLRLAPLLYES